MGGTAARDTGMEKQEVEKKARLKALKANGGPCSSSEIPAPYSTSLNSRKELLVPYALSCKLQ